MANPFGARVSVRVARLLYWRWESLAPSEREPLEPLAADLKERALEVRGKVDDGQAARDLEAATAELAEAMGADEVAELREQLRRELERAERRQRERPAA
jgi:hypothetical protein